MPKENDFGMLQLCGRWNIRYLDICDLHFYEFWEIIRGAQEREWERWRMAVQSGLLPTNCWLKNPLKIRDVIRFPNDKLPIASFAGPGALQKGLEKAKELLDGS